MGDSLGRAFNPSILFMLAMPFVVVGAIAGGLAYAYRRAQKNTDNVDAADKHRLDG